MPGRRANKFHKKSPKLSSIDMDEMGEYDQSHVDLEKVELTNLVNDNTHHSKKGAKNKCNKMTTIGTNSSMAATADGKRNTDNLTLPGPLIGGRCYSRERELLKNVYNDCTIFDDIAFAFVNSSGKVGSKHFTRRLLHDDHNRLRKLISHLAAVTIVDKATPTEQWNQYVAMYDIIQKIREIEEPLRKYSEQVRSNDSEENIQARFYDWAKENDIKINEGLIINDYDDYGLGIKAIKDIHDNEVLFTIPYKAILSEEYNDNLRSAFNANLRLAIILMSEALNPNSVWRPYIDMLPKDYNTVLYYTPDQMKLLHGSNSLPDALRQYRLIAKYYVTLSNWPHFNFFEYFHYDIYRWAVSTVMTRENLIPRSRLLSAVTKKDSSIKAVGVTLESESVVTALIPFWDLLNHSNGRITSFLDMEKGCIESHAQRNFKKGEQVFMHYGDRSNADFLIHNGFIETNNPHDNVPIRMGLSATDPLYQKRFNILEELNLSKSGEWKVLPAPRYFSAELIAFVRIFNMSLEELDVCLQSNPSELLLPDYAASKELEQKVWSYLRTRLMLLLRLFPETLAQDEATLRQLQSGNIHQVDAIYKSYIGMMALQFRILEKRMLTDAMNYAKVMCSTD